MPKVNVDEGIWLDFDKIEAIMQARKWTLWDLCVKAGMQPGMISRKKKTSSQTTFKTVKRIANSLGVYARELIGEDPPPESQRRPPVRIPVRVKRESVAA